MSVAAAIMTGLSVVGTVMGGIQEKKAARAEARGLDENARLAELQGEQEAATTAREERRISGEAIAAMAGSGAMLGTGSALDIIRQNAIEREVEIGNIRAEAGRQAADYRFQARQSRKAGKAALINAGFSVVSQVAGAAFGGQTGSMLSAQAGRERASRLPRMGTRTMGSLRTFGAQTRLRVTGAPGD